MKSLYIRSVFIFLFVYLSYNANAQEIELIQRNHVFHNMSTGGSSSDRSYTFLVEGESSPRKAGYFGQHLKRYIQSDTTAARYISSYATHQAFKLGTTVTTVGFFSAFAISNLSKESVARENLDEGFKGKGLLVAAIGSFAVNVILRAIHPRSIQKAVDSYNNSADAGALRFNGFELDTQTLAGTKSFNLKLKFNF